MKMKIGNKGQTHAFTAQTASSHSTNLQDLRKENSSERKDPRKSELVSASLDDAAKQKSIIVAQRSIPP
jgi:hypothetical protein